MVKVRVTKAESFDHAKKKLTASLFADQKSDITSDMKVEGLPDGYELDFGSDVFTADGEIAYLKSDGTWNWIGE